MDLKRIRKAIAAGVGATVAALVPALINGDQPATAQGWGALIGGAVALGVVTGWATYRVPNAGTVNGSDPQHDLGDVASGNLPASGSRTFTSGQAQVHPPRDGYEGGGGVR